MSPFLPRWNLGKPFLSQKVKEICTSLSHNYPEAWWHSPDLMQPFGTSCQARRWPHGWGEGAAALRLTSEMTLVREHRLVRKTDSSAWSHFPGEYRHEAGMCSGNYEVLWKIKMARLLLDQAFFNQHWKCQKTNPSCEQSILLLLLFNPRKNGFVLFPLFFLPSWFD